MTHKEYLELHHDRFIGELTEFLTFPSISTAPEHAGDVRACGEWLIQHLQSIGIKNAELHETPGHPIVYAEHCEAGPDKPTVLFYGHYDVQPVDPLDLWTNPPFTPVFRDGKVFARGATDDKGQVFLHLKAFEALLAIDGTLPVNVKILLEGEEEIGSINLPDYIENNKERLACDAVVVSDTPLYGPGLPSLCYGLRGLCYMEIHVQGPNRDLHSGLYGGAVANPINVLTKMIASLNDENNHITIPGFYDKVEELSAAERAEMAKAPFSLDAYKKALDIAEVYGETGYLTNERNSIRPTLDVNGIWGGYTGEGAKTVIASKAYAKISMRLVPNQDWEEITELFSKHFMSIAPKSVTVKVTPHHGGQGYVTPIDSIGYKAANQAYTETFGVPAIPVRSGGSIPIVALFEKELKSKTILMGFGLDSDAIHSPNEHFGIFNYLKGIETIPLFYKYFVEMSK